MGIAASFGAPIVSVVYGLFSSMSASRDSVFSVLGAMILSALLFSFVCTELLVLVTIVIARIVRPRRINILSITLFYLVCLAAAVAIGYGTTQAMIVFGLAFPNALIIVVLARMKFEKGQFTA
jgi:hypothetical protein